MHGTAPLGPKVPRQGTGDGHAPQTSYAVTVATHRREMDKKIHNGPIGPLCCFYI
jgi:hypothetical protein